MRIPCPCCGTRDRREFTCYGAEDFLHRPDPDAPAPDWDNYLHLRDNLAGEVRDLWYHDPCGTWVVVTRDTVTHAISAAVAVAEREGAA